MFSLISRVFEHKINQLYIMERNQWRTITFHLRENVVCEVVAHLLFEHQVLQLSYQQSLEETEENNREQKIWI